MAMMTDLSNFIQGLLMPSSYPAPDLWAAQQVLSAITPEPDRYVQSPSHTPIFKGTSFLWSCTPYQPHVGEVILIEGPDSGSDAVIGSDSAQPDVTPPDVYHPDIPSADDEKDATGGMDVFTDILNDIKILTDSEDVAIPDTNVEKGDADGTDVFLDVFNDIKALTDSEDITIPVTDVPKMDAGGPEVVNDITISPDVPLPPTCGLKVNIPASCNITDITAGETATCVALKNGTVKCWGEISTTFGSQKILLFSSPTPNAVPAFQNVSQISLRLQHLCARTTAGGVICMGQNNWSQLGDGSTADSTAAVAVPNFQNISAVAVGSFHSCALNTAGVMYCWGQNYFKQLGGSLNAVVTKPVAVSFSTPEAVTGMNVGPLHSCAILQSGAVFCWGDNSANQIGNPVTLGKKVAAPTLLTNLTKSVLGVGTGAEFTCVLEDNCSAACVSDNQFGQLGLGNDPTTTSLNPIPSLAGLAGIYGGGQTAAALTTTGTVYAWGNNDVGQAATGAIGGTVTKPAQVSGLPKSIVRVAIGANHTCVLDEGCNTYCWGANNAGQLGDGTQKNSAIPVKMAISP